jgi:hypothetical protein
VKVLPALYRWLMMVSAIGSITACVASVMTQPSGTFNGKAQYRVECEDQDEARSSCRAAMAKTCPTGHTMTGYTDQVIVTVPPTKQPRYLYFVCAP